MPAFALVSGHLSRSDITPRRMVAIVKTLAAFLVFQVRLLVLMLVLVLLLLVVLVVVVLLLLMVLLILPPLQTLYFILEQVEFSALHRCIRIPAVIPYVILLFTLK